MKTIKLFNEIEKYFPAVEKHFYACYFWEPGDYRSTESLRQARDEMLAWVRETCLRNGSPLVQRFNACGVYNRLDMARIVPDWFVYDATDRGVEGVFIIREDRLPALR